MQAKRASKIGVGAVYDRGLPYGFRGSLLEKPYTSPEHLNSAKTSCVLMDNPMAQYKGASSFETRLALRRIWAKEPRHSEHKISGNVQPLSHSASIINLLSTTLPVNTLDRGMNGDQFSSHHCRHDTTHPVSASSQPRLD